MMNKNVLIFYSPVAKLSEELAVTLVDDEENEIAYTGVFFYQYAN